MSEIDHVLASAVDFGGEIRKFELIAVHGYPRLSILVSVVNPKHICNFLLVNNSNFGRISYCFRDICA